jgi:type I restriction enzyme S subunit
MSFKLTIGRVAIAGIDLYTNEAIVAVNGYRNLVDNKWLYHTLPTIISGAVVDVAVKGVTLNKRKLQDLSLIFNLWVGRVFTTPAWS